MPATRLRFDNILLVVEDLDAAIAFFTALGMEIEGRSTVEGDPVDRLIGLEGTRAELVSMRAPDGSGRIELDKYHAPPVVRPQPDAAPVNTLGYRRIMFEVDDLDGRLERLLAGGAELVGDVVRYGDSHRLVYVRGPEGIIVALAEPLG